jgi:hypothetical protein
MIIDNNLVLSGSVSSAGVLSGQLITNNSTLSTNTIDTAPLTVGSNQVADMGAGEDLTLEFSILVAPTVCTAVQFQLIQADDAALSTNVDIINETSAIVIASLPAGTVVPLHYDRAAPLAPRRYVGARYISTGSTVATMSVFASVVKDVQDVKNTLYKSGFAIL